MDLLSPLALPEALPSYDDTAGRIALARLTHGRLPAHLDFDVLEKRARRLLYTLGGVCSELRGSQYGRDNCYYVELVAHEYAHCLFLGLRGVRPLAAELDNIFRTLSVEVGNENELRTAAATMLVMEMLGMPYDPLLLVTSTMSNLRRHLYRASEVYSWLLERRKLPEVVDVARQIAARLLKMKYGNQDQGPDLPPATG